MADQEQKGGTLPGSRKEGCTKITSSVVEVILTFFLAGFAMQRRNPTIHGRFDFLYLFQDVHHILVFISSHLISVLCFNLLGACA